MPRNSIAVHRPYAWAKYWSERGVAVTVLTAKKYAYDEPLDLNLPALASVEVVEVEYRTAAVASARQDGFKSIIGEKLVWLLKKNASLIKNILGLDYDVRDAWAKHAIPVALDFHEKRKFDVIVSTYGPRACHFIANEVKIRNPKVKWLADYRDMWSIRHNSDLSGARLKAEHALEMRVVMNADLVTTVSKPLAIELSRFLKKDVHVVLNGYDSELDDFTARLKECKRNLEGSSRRLKIVYTGMIYPGWQDPSPLFFAINNLIEAKKVRSEEICVDFFGKRQPGLKDLVERNCAEDYVTIHGHVSRQIAVREQADADLLLLLESGKPEAKGVLTGKIFEYMISGKPILSLGSTGDSAIGEIIAETGVGVVCGDDIKKIESILLRVLHNDLVGIYEPNIYRIAKYNRKTQAQELLELVENSSKDGRIN